MGYFSSGGFWRWKVAKVSARVSSEMGGTLQVCADGHVIADIEVPVTVGRWQTLTVPLTGLQEGAHNLCVSLSSGRNVQVDWIRFE